MAKEFTIPPVSFPTATTHQTSTTTTTSTIPTTMHSTATGAPPPLHNRVPTAPFQPSFPSSLPFMSFDISSAAAAAASSTTSFPPPHLASSSSSSSLFLDEPSLLEELEINPTLIWRKTRSLLNPFRPDPSLHSSDPDLSGPFLYYLSFSLFQLLAGKVQFGIILGWIAISSVFLYSVLNFLAGRHGSLDLYRCVSIVGYCLMPVVLFSAAALFLPPIGSSVVGLAVAGFFVVWATRVCSRLLAEDSLGCSEHQAQPSGLSISEKSSSAELEYDQSVELFLDKPISCIEGLSKKHSRQLEDCEIHTLHHFPRTYADLHNSHFGIEDGQYIIFVGKVLSSRAIKASFSLSFHQVIVSGEAVNQMADGEVDSDGSNSGGKRQIYMHLKKFLRGTRYTSSDFLKILEKKHKEGDIVCASGKVKTTSKEGHYEIREYSLDVIENEGESCLSLEGRPYPIYPSKGGLKPQFLRDIIARVLQSMTSNIDPIPRDITRDIGLPSLNELGRLYQMLDGLGSRIEKEGLLDKFRNIDQSSTLAEDWCDLTRSFLEGLPYSLTKSQLNAVSEIIWDLKQPIPMNRLLQGDVGCGKTVVAFLACMEVIGSGYQAAYMVPTELLAIQHYNDFISLLENVKPDERPSVALLTGSTPTKQGRIIRDDLQSGSTSIVIGTHSLIAESVRFSYLRLAVIDEQHRFGVIQRGRFNSKLWYSSTMLGAGETTPIGTSKAETQMAPHVLAMSATPIPRSLALALYGDMSLTQITDLPPGRLPIETKIVEGNQIGFEKVYEMMHYELETGGKVYIVYPIIEQSEQLPQLRAASGDYEDVCSRFSTYKCGLLHGRMKGGEKDKALKDFRVGETQILLATQVIEIGVDVPDASMMVVMNAERFGIAQLHQLRGRVGRGCRKSKCILVASSPSSVGRLRVLESSSDGFSLAKVDLLMRGPGDLLGKKQSGHLPEFPIARLEIDGTIIQDAHVAALRILSASYDLVKYPELKAELSMRQPLSLFGD